MNLIAKTVTNFRNNPWILSVTAGILLGVSFQPFDLPILQLPAFLLLFRVAALSRSGRELCLYAWPAFLIWNLIVTYWLMMATVPAGVAAITANAGLMLLPLALIRHLLLAGKNRLVTAALAASVWTTYEFLHHHWELAWPWLTLGNGWSNFPMLIQYISITGYLSISFWMVFSAGLIYFFLTEKRRIWLYYGTAVLLLFPLLSLATLAVWQEPDAEPVETVVIQHNIDSYQPLAGFGSVDEIITHLLSMTGETVTPGTDVVLWPENAVTTTLSRNSPQIARIRDSLSVWNTELITGTGFVDYYDDPETEPFIVRGRINGVAYNVFNASLHLSPDRPAPDIYRKGKLVPVVERMPYANFLKRLDLFGWVDWGAVTNYGRGETANNFHISGREAASMICYDSVFPDWVGRYVRNGAEYLTIVTNDGWWGKTSGHIQHFAFARLRAIEYRRWIARSANNGISGIISPAGEIKVETEFWTEAAFSYRIIPDRRLTFYARFGNWFNWLMLFGTGVSLLLLRIDKKKRQGFTIH